MGMSSLSARTFPANSNATLAVYVIKVDAEPTSVTLTAGTSGSLVVSASGLLTGTTPVEVTEWAAATDELQIAVVSQANTTIKTIAVNGDVVADSTDFAVAKAGSYTVTVTVEDDYSKALHVYTYGFTVEEAED